MPRLDVYRRRRRVPLHDNDEGVVSVRKGGAVRSASRCVPPRPRGTRAGSRRATAPTLRDSSAAASAQHRSVTGRGPPAGRQQRRRTAAGRGARLC